MLDLSSKDTDTWFRKCVRYELILEIFTSKMCSNHVMKIKLQVQKVNK